MPRQTTRCSPDALPSTLGGGGMMLLPCPAVCAAPHDAAPATHTAVRPARTRRRCRCQAPAATNPGTGVLEQSSVEVVGAETAAAAPPAAWLPQALPFPQVTSPPAREGDWSQKHYSQVCHDPPGSPLLALLPCLVRGGRVRRLTRKVVGGLLAGRHSQGPGTEVRTGLPHRVPRHTACCYGKAACSAAGRVRCGLASIWPLRQHDNRGSFPPSRDPVRVLFVSESNLCRSVLAGV